MKIVSLVSPNLRQGPRELNAYFLPYSLGVVWSYVKQFDTISKNYRLGEMIWRREPITEVVDKLKNHDVIGFSTYVWNRNYNTTLAKKLKEANPDIKIVFGGPELPIENLDFFQEFPYIDIHAKQEGETTFKLILEHYLYNTNIDSIPRIIYNKNKESVDTGFAERINDLDILPSPYLDGTFDYLLVKYPEVTWNSILETNRGCPYQCTFCDWGSLTYNKVKKFNLERVFQEIEWIAKNKSEFVTFTDANFGIFIERDNLIIDKIIECQKTYGYPKYFNMTWAKNQKREVVNIVKKIIDNSPTNNGLSISVQTLTESVLNIIKRTNLESKQINQMFEDCEKLNIPLFTELILGLPGETLETWKTNFWKLFELGNHTGITVHQAALLENAEMNLVQKKLYKIESKPVHDYLTIDDEYDNLVESIDIVTGTKDMPYNKMLDAHVFNWFINTFHLDGITTYISRFFKKYYGIDYENFYEQLYSYLKKESWFVEQENKIREYFTEWVNRGSVGPVYINGKVIIVSRNMINYSTMHMHYYGTYELVFDTLKEFVYTFNLDREIINELLKFQKNYIVNAHCLHDYPKQIDFDIDLLGYLQDNTNLLTPSKVQFDYVDSKNISIERFTENIYYARKRNFGRTTVTKIK